MNIFNELKLWQITAKESRDFLIIPHDVAIIEKEPIVNLVNKTIIELDRLYKFIDISSKGLLLVAEELEREIRITNSLTKELNKR